MQNNQEMIRKAMELANSPQGQQLIRMLQLTNQADLQRAMDSAASGDYSAAKQTLNSLLNNPEAQKLLHQMGGHHGSDGR